ncbi:FMN-binding negative transcriptional regulator [Dechloromonas sp. HYN0024]|uniref:FMN-binding negative transcriptional regulator n=1 Tax=Dechloromonas sp. HYN0024 TaxID=2231055 RepID=UPI000E43D810|nr:FMN-binding negative transcriptional regulator [Dechloromonas sp. HYN0024]AXS78644.1 FMN-binding negative transcriptional regulator [Dechloromonas sp. HYN0024]
MYLPKHFAENDIGVMHALMRAHPLATLVTQGPDGLDANHIPLHLDAASGSNGTLRGHVARSNPLMADGATNAAPSGNQGILVIFQGPESYISPSGYATKAEHGKVVPTWNYTAVHAYGELRLIDDADWLLAQLRTLTAEHESGLPHPWAVDDAPADYIRKMLGAVVGIEIRIERLIGKWKVSQNQPAVNQASLIAALDGQPMADLIRQRQQ